MPTRMLVHIDRLTYSHDHLDVRQHHIGIVVQGYVVEEKQNVSIHGTVFVVEGLKPRFRYDGVYPPLSVVDRMCDWTNYVTPAFMLNNV